MKYFSEHPATVDETYLEHMKFALIFSARLILAGFSCMIHAIFPFLFKETATSYLAKIISDINDSKRANKFNERLEKCNENQKLE